MSELKIYRFGTTTEGSASMKDTLGGKGANLAEMSKLGLPVPPGFTIPCEASVAFDKLVLVPDVSDFITQIQSLVSEGIAYLVGKGGKSPLMSVRSGSRVSMPGMMDTILNVGLTAKTLPYWVGKLGEIPALDSYRRFIQMYASVALGIDLEMFEQALEDARKTAGVKLDSELGVDDLKALIKRYLAIVDSQGKVFPDNPLDQLTGAVIAVFKSWNNPRAVEYRKINNIPNSWGTAVTVQSMVFGNLNNDSCTGVLFSRDPSTGAKVITGEYLVNAQGEDVVAGIRTPENMSNLHEWNITVASTLFDIVDGLEQHYKDMQDIEFTVEDSKLYILQTRNGKRSAMAAFQVAHDLAVEGLITKEVAASRVNAAQLFSVMQDRIDPSFKVPACFTGIAAGGGVVKGVAMFNSSSAINCKVPCILVTKETDPDDIAGMNASVGILTATGGLTSHAAVVARGMNKSCVVGATGLEFKPSKGDPTMAVMPDGGSFSEGDMITIDGATGNVWALTNVPLIAGGASPLVRRVIQWGVNSPVSDRLELNPEMSEAELLQLIKDSNSDSIYIDTVLIEGVDSLVSTSCISSRLYCLGNLLKESSASEIIIDLSGRDEHYSRGDLAFDTMFGVKDSNTNQIFKAKMQAVESWDSKVKSRTVINLSLKNSHWKQELENSGFKVSGHVTTFSDLLVATGPMNITPEVIAKVFGNTGAYEVAKKAIEALTGTAPMGSMPTPVYWYEPLTCKG